MRVLLVDDDVTFRYSLERALKKAQHTVEATATAKQASDKLRDEAFDAVVCDFNLQGSDGGEGLVRWLASFSPSTRVIVVTSSVSDETRGFYAGTGVQIFSKPMDVVTLVELIEQLGVRKGFYGTSIEVELFDYVQMVALSGRDKLVEVKTPDGVGQIWFEHGDTTHVEFGDLIGEEAFYRLLHSGRGTFREVFFHEPPQQSVMGSSMSLLMEAARRMDEGLIGDGPKQDPSGGDAAESGEHDDEQSFADLSADLSDEGAAGSATQLSASDLESVGLGIPSDDDEGHAGVKAPARAPARPPKASARPPRAAGGEEEKRQAKPASTPAAARSGTGASVKADASGSARAESGPKSAADSLIGEDVLTDPESRSLLLEQFFQFEGVDGAAIVSQTGRVIAEDMRGRNSLTVLAGSYMRGAARLARALGYNVFDEVVARSDNGQQLLVVSMGGTSAVLSVDKDHDANRVLAEVIGSDA